MLSCFELYLATIIFFYVQHMLPDVAVENEKKEIIKNMKKQVFFMYLNFRMGFLFFLFFIFGEKTSYFPMDTPSSIRHRFDVEIPRGKFVKITSILKGESTWEL